MKLPEKQREQSRLAAPVRADNADPLAGMEREVGTVQEEFRRAAKRELAERNHGAGL
jgi:hypothetical protein